MTDTSTDGNGMRGMDDDRLLAFALGLEDDPELERAAAADDELRRRLDAMRADVARAGERVRAAVPEPGAAYTDLSDPRWHELGEYLEAPRPARTRSRLRRLRLLAPAALVVAAVLVGVAVVEHLGTGGREKGGVDTTAVERSRNAADGNVGGTGEWPQRSALPAGLTPQETLDELAPQYRLIVVARAGQTDGAVQSFTVLRALKGRAPDVLRLRLAGKPAAAGKPHLLFLRPVATGALGASADGGAGLSGSPVPTPAASGTSGGFGGLAFIYQGTPAIGLRVPLSMAAPLRLP